MLDEQVIVKTKALFKNKAREVQYAVGDIVNPIAPQRLLDIGWDGENVTFYYVILNQLYHSVCSMAEVFVEEDGMIHTPASSPDDTKNIKKRIIENFKNFFNTRFGFLVDVSHFISRKWGWCGGASYSLMKINHWDGYGDIETEIKATNYTDDERWALDFLPVNFTYFSVTVENMIGMQLLKEENPEEYAYLIESKYSKTPNMKLIRLIGHVAKSTAKEWEGFEALGNWATWQQADVVNQIELMYCHINSSDDFEKIEKTEEEVRNLIWRTSEGKEPTHSWENPYKHFAEASKLYLLGYSVAKESPLSTPQRQALLRDIVESGEMDIIDINTHLNFLWTQAKSNPKFDDAKEHWRADLIYLRDHFVGDRFKD